MSNVVVVVAVPDLMFQSRVVAAVEGLQLEPRIADTQDAALHEIIESAPALVVVDLQASGIDAGAAIAAARAAGARVLAFGRHTDAEALRAAREAGADRAVARSQFVEDLPRLINELVLDNA